MKSAKKAIVILGAGILQLNLIKEAKKRYKTIVVDMNKNAAGVSFADVFLPVSTKDKEKLIEALKPFEKELALCLVSGSDMTPTVAAVNEKFNLKGVNKTQSLVTSHKGEMRNFCKKHNIRQPLFTVSKNKDDLIKFIQQNTYKEGYVIKPVQNMGARGVMHVKCVQDLSFAFEYSSCFSENEEVILEYYLPGPEYSADALVIDGKVFITGFADRNIKLFEDRYFIETGHTMPSASSNEILKKSEKLLQQFADALASLSDRPYLGALKADLRLYNNEIYAGEIASRLSGGFMSTHTYPYASGHNLMSAYLDIFEDKVPLFIKQNKNNQYKNVCIERAFITEWGRLKKIKIKNKRKYKNLKNIFLHYKREDLIPPLKSNLGKTANFIITGKSLKEAEETWDNIQKEIEYKVEPPGLTASEVLKYSRKKMKVKYCRVCPVCDGKKCASAVPGMGGVGHMKTFQNNISAFKAIKIMKHNSIKNNKVNPDISFEFLGNTLNIPILTAPITGCKTNLGLSINEWDLAIETGEAALKMGTLPLFGDGASEDKYLIGLKAIEQLKKGIPIFKPIDNNDVTLAKIKEAQRSGALAWGMDIDSVGLKTLELKGVKTSKKNIDDLKKLRLSSGLPFIVKGVMTIEEAKIACEAKAYAVIISNHGGRISDDLPASVDVVEEISAFIRKNYLNVKILADGGIRSGGDIFKMLALGANAVLIGRPLAIAAVGLGRLGVHSLLSQYTFELKEIMRKLGIMNLANINKDYIVKAI
ncbi:MAG: alpha-hydroxy-acid oxidizing protein [Spirochaetia bacterium]|nr:alpha-hydroxy-acid oxidizing protein [Spirochaetia bacterium]